MPQQFVRVIRGDAMTTAFAAAQPLCEPPKGTLFGTAIRSTSPISCNCAGVRGLLAEAARINDGDMWFHVKRRSRKYFYRSVEHRLAAAIFLPPADGATGFGSLFPYSSSVENIKARGRLRGLRVD